MHPLRRFTNALLNVLGTSYALALLALLLLHLFGRDHRWWIAFFINFMPFYFVPLFGFVALALVARARPALIATIPLALVGLVLYGPLFLTKPTAAVSGSTVTVITLNVSDSNQHLDMVLAWLRQQDADVVFLQEAAVDRFTPLRQALDDLYPQQVQQLTEEGYRGNLILSHYPLIAASVPNSRAFQSATFTANGQSVAFYNVSLVTPVDAAPHRNLPFEYPFLDLAIRYDDRDRNQQIEQLLAEVQAQTLPYVVAGDFNMSDQTGIYTSLANQMGDSFRESGTGLGASWPAFESAGLGFLPALIRIDYVWHSRDFLPVHAEVGPYLGSDHLPVWTTLSFVP